MICLILDILMSYFSLFPTNFFLLNVLLIPKNKYPKLLFLTLLVDIIIYNKYFYFTLVMFLIFVLYKKMFITNVNLISYILSLTFIYVLYIILFGIINGYSLAYLCQYIFLNYGFSLVFYLISYKIIYKHIKLSR